MNGETVQIEFSSADASTAAAVTIKDANNVTITVASDQRLLIDTLTCSLAAAVTLLEVFGDTDADAAVDANELIAAFGANNGLFVAGEEGYPCRTGATPKVKASGAGAVRVTGNGRIVNALGRTTRPSWVAEGH